jgi:hypothetical protein
MSDQHPRMEDEWRVEVRLEADEAGHSLGERLRSIDLDDEARKRLGGSVVVTRDGPHLFLYAWHEQGAREAERVIRELLEQDGLAAEVELTRWHPVEDAWKPASEPLPETEADVEAERRAHEQAEAAEAAESGRYDWEAVVELPDLRTTLDYAKQLEQRELPVKRRWKYLLIGTTTEENAIALGEELEQEAPEGAKVSVRANPSDMPHPVFVQLGSWKPGPLRDLGL